MLRSYKIFVRQTEEDLNEKFTNDASKLNFHGNEAKKVYEEIIQQTQGHQYSSKDTPMSYFKKSLTLKSQKSKQKSAEIQVNVNQVLKATEQADWIFLEANMNKNNVNIVDDYGWTPLMSAAFAGHVKIVKFLLDLGADRRLREKTGLTACQLARKKNHDEIIALLRTKTSTKTEENLRNFSDERLDGLEEFYCAVCERNFKETNVKKHEASMLHIFNTNPKLPAPVYGIPKQNKGYQMMLNTGWEESRGLGPSGSGQKYPVKTILKRDRKGLGKSSKDKPRVTHFNSNDPAAIKHVRHEKPRIYGRKQIEKYRKKEARKERAIRQALS